MFERAQAHRQGATKVAEERRHRDRTRLPGTGMDALDFRHAQIGMICRGVSNHGAAPFQFMRLC